MLIIDKNSTYIDDSVKLGTNVKIYPNNVICEGSVIEDGVTLYPGNYITNSTIKAGSVVTCSVIEDSVVGENCKVGPFAHLRPGSKICERARIGNFVEIKNSQIGEGTKVSHLSYVGDAEVGNDVNVGCGVVFVNYNGRTKSKTQVGNGSFIGSSVNLIAPVKIGDKAFICAGTTVDKDVESGDFIIGRSKMNVKKARAKNYLKEN